MTSSREFAGRTALITGASRGFGRTLATAFLRAGADLLLIARNASALGKVAAELKADRHATQKVVTVVVDLANTEDAVRIIAAHGARVDILVNNAAIQGPVGPLSSVDMAAWRGAVSLDLVAPVALMQAVLPAMVARRWGRIINVSGGGATAPRPNFTAYAAAKTALVRVTESVASELAGTGVTVNAVAPGTMNTDMNAELRREGVERAGTKEIEAAERIARTEGPPGSIAAELCVYLASDAASGVTGRLIAALWDPWREFNSLAPEMAGTDIYTLRRILPKDRGLPWKDSQ